MKPLKGVLVKLDIKLSRLLVEILRTLVAPIQTKIEEPTESNSE